MTSKKPYFIRAIYEWLVDNQLTPHILVNANYPGLSIPQEFVSNGRIVLNISPEACRGLHIANDHIVFTARFANKAEQLFVLPHAILAIYAQENGEGMEFPIEETNTEISSVKPNADINTVTPIVSLSRRNKPNLTLIKKDDEK